MRAPSVAVLVCVLGWRLFGPAVFAQDGPDLDALLADVRRVEGESNPDRGQALMRMLEERGIPYELEAFDIVEPQRPYPRTMGGNIVVTLGRGTSDIVIGAHYDAAWLSDGALSRGAVDNAASSVILTRLAEALDQESLRHRIRIVFFDVEEVGLKGSQAYIRKHDDAPIAGAINMDVNGYGDTIVWGASANGGNLELHDAMRALCAEAEFACSEYPRYPASDHLSFQRAGIPNISVSVLPSDEAEAMRTALNGTEDEVRALGETPRVLRLIHTPQDTSDLIEPFGMALTFRAVLDLVRRLDDSLE